ncbi:MAG: BLUF domain-containing protein [Verrucomicrobiota bacterium]|nr:BLUF domain-containing protein [Verrucomicrobiota bacterium]
MNPLFLVYASIANEDFSPDQLIELLATSRRNNEASGLTGMLLYKDRRFLQVLEGNEEAVRATYARIERDPRHREIVLLLSEEEQEREFADWSMAFQDLDDATASQVPGFSPFLGTQLSPHEFQDDPSRARKLLRVFRRI